MVRVHGGSPLYARGGGHLVITSESLRADQYLRPLDFFAQIGVEIVKSTAGGEGEVTSLEPQYDQTLRRAVATAGVTDSEAAGAAKLCASARPPPGAGRCLASGSRNRCFGQTYMAGRSTLPRRDWLLYVVNHGGAAVEVNLSLPAAARSLKDLRRDAALRPGGLITLGSGETRLIAIEQEHEESRP
jgi:hypothetical protein